MGDASLVTGSGKTRDIRNDATPQRYNRGVPMHARINQSIQQQRKIFQVLESLTIGELIFRDLKRPQRFLHGSRVQRADGFVANQENLLPRYHAREQSRVTEQAAPNMDGVGTAGHIDRHCFHCRITCRP